MKSKNDYIKSIYLDFLKVLKALESVHIEEEKEHQEHIKLLDINSKAKENIIGQSMINNVKTAAKVAIKNNDTDSIKSILDSIAIDILYITKQKDGQAEQHDRPF